MNLEAHSIELKQLVSRFETQWFLGDLTGLMGGIGKGRAKDQLSKLSSPLRQLYYLGGLHITSASSDNIVTRYTNAEWNKMVVLLNQIEQDYETLFATQAKNETNGGWKLKWKIAVPSFLAYFNQGPLNFEEQPLNWIRDLYTRLDRVIEQATGVKTADFIQFYEALDALSQKNFRSYFPPVNVKANWREYTNVRLVSALPYALADLAPSDAELAFNHFVADYGIIKRFYATELVSSSLPLEKIHAILQLLTCKREESDFLYYASTKPGNPLYDTPIIDLGSGLYQVFEVKQVAHAIDQLLQSTCSKSQKGTQGLIKWKGDLLENRVVELFSKLFGDEAEIHQSYFVDGNERDVLVLWRNHAFIIEAKGYNLREPLRNPEMAFERIKNDFKTSVGYGYLQTQSVAQKFARQEILRLDKDKKGSLLKEIDTSQYKGRDFSIVVTLQSFGQVQTDLSALLEVEDDDVYPWAVKLDDLETFILTLIAKKKSPKEFVDFLLMREELHGKLFCSDESEITGAFLTKQLTFGKIKHNNRLVVTTPDLSDVFDQQYEKGLGFKNEKYLKEKKDGRYIFW